MGKIQIAVAREQREQQSRPEAGAPRYCAAQQPAPGIGVALGAGTPNHVQCRVRQVQAQQHRCGGQPGASEQGLHGFLFSAGSLHGSEASPERQHAIRAPIESPLAYRMPTRQT
jgi:hypothetical protein